MTTTNLNSRAMLVNLTISAWSARKLDRKVTREVDVLHNATDAGRYNKLLIAKGRIDEVTKAANALRQEHYRLTLPWKDKGERILPAAAFDAYSEAIRKYRGAFEQAVTEFCRDYPVLVEEARIRLNGLFNEADYPPPQNIAKRFGVDLSINPVPTGDDFRVNLSDEIAQSIKDRIDSDAKDTLQAAMREVWNRLYDAVAKMSDRLVGNEDGKVRIYDSLVENLRDITSLLPKLNLTDDRRLEELRVAVEEKLCKASPNDLRNDARLRKSQAEEAKAICEAMAGFMGGAPVEPVEWKSE